MLFFWFIFPVISSCKSNQTHIHHFHPQCYTRKKLMGSETFVEVLLAILLPPVGVFLRYGCGAEFWIDLLLTILGYIPGIIYAIYVLVV